MSHLRLLSDSASTRAWSGLYDGDFVLTLWFEGSNRPLVMS